MLGNQVTRSSVSCWAQRPVQFACLRTSAAKQAMRVVSRTAVWAGAHQGGLVEGGCLEAQQRHGGGGDVGQAGVGQVVPVICVCVCVCGGGGGRVLGAWQVVVGAAGGVGQILVRQRGHDSCIFGQFISLPPTHARARTQFHTHLSTTLSGSPLPPMKTGTGARVWDVKGRGLPYSSTCREPACDVWVRAREGACMFTYVWTVKGRGLPSSYNCSE